MITINIIRQRISSCIKDTLDRWNIIKEHSLAKEWIFIHGVGVDLVNLQDTSIYKSSPCGMKINIAMLVVLGWGTSPYY